MTLHQIRLSEFVGQHERVTGQLRHGELMIDLHRIRVSYCERNVQVSADQFRLLCYAIRRPGKLLTIEEIVAELWWGEDMRSNAVAALMYRLREALAKVGARHIIKTIPKKGYILRKVLEDREAERAS